MKLLNSNGWEKYYQTNLEVSWKQEVDEYLLEHLNNINGHSALDVACGDGRNTFPLMQTFSSVTCTDLSATALERLKLRMNEEFEKSPIVIPGDFLTIDLPSDSFDLTICLDGLPQMPNIDLALERLCSLTAPQGHLLFNFFTKNDVAYGEGQKIDENSYIYKETLFQFLSRDEVLGLIPSNMKVIDCQVKTWFDPPHGEFRPYPHQHEASFWVLERLS